MPPARVVCGKVAHGALAILCYAAGYMAPPGEVQSWFESERGGRAASEAIKRQLPSRCSKNHSQRSGLRVIHSGR
jgi:hypothetical protein